MTKKILVGVDGSSAAQEALSWVVNLAGCLDAKVIALHSLGLLASDYEGNIVPTEAHRNEIVQEFETSWCASLVRGSVPFTPVVVDGAPVSAILVVAAEMEVDMIVLGSRVHKVSSELLGSTSHQVAARASCPVVIVPPPKQA